MLKKTARAAALVFFGIFLAFLVIEIGFRWLDLGRDNFTEGHPLWGWFHIPGKKGIHTGANFRVKIQINSQGLRDKEHTQEKPAGTYRIVVLGDSFMEALQMPLEDIFSRQLEKKLQEVTPDKKIEVINLGCGGFGTDQEYLSLKHLGLSYKPDLVILAFFSTNDVRDNYFERNKPRFNLDAQGKLSAEPFSFKPPSAAKSLLKKSKAVNNLFMKLAESHKLYNLMARLGIAAGGPRGQINDQRVYSKVYPEDWNKAWELTLALIQETRQLSESSGAKFLLLHLTSREQLRDESSRKGLLAQGFDVERPDKILQDFSRKNELSYLSLIYPFRDYLVKHHLKTEDFHMWGDNHWTALSHRLAAEEVKAKVIADPRLAFSQHPAN